MHSTNKKFAHKGLLFLPTKCPQELIKLSVIKRYKVEEMLLNQCLWCVEILQI